MKVAVNQQLFHIVKQHRLKGHVLLLLNFLPGISTMMWSTFIVKRLSAAAFLMEKVSPARMVYNHACVAE